jgi:hypothetical protein
LGHKSKEEEMLKLQDIPRIRVGQEMPILSEKLDAFGRERAELATKAKNLLGYKVLSGEISGSFQATSVELGKLATALLALDLEVLDMGMVFAYQVDEAARRTKQELDRLVRGGQVKQVFQWGFSPAEWKHTELKSYGEAIPEFVLDKAVRLKEKCPDVQFFVHHLNDPKADPFLVATLGEEVFFLEAWDEPRFEGRITK